MRDNRPTSNTGVNSSSSALTKSQIQLQKPQGPHHKSLNLWWCAWTGFCIFWIRCQVKFLTSAKFLDLIFFVSYYASQNRRIKFGNYFFDVCCANWNFLVRCQIPTTSLRFENNYNHWKISDLVLDLNYFYFSNPNPKHLPEPQTLSTNHQFFKPIWYVEYYSMQVHMVWSQKFRKSEISLDNGVLLPKTGSGVRFSLLQPEPVSNVISELCEISDLLLFVSYFASQSEEIKFGNYFFDVCCSVERIEEICNPNPVPNFQCVIRSDPIRYYCLNIWSNPVDIWKKPLIKHLTAVINTVWISVSDPVEFFSKSNPIRVRLWIAESGWIAIRKPDHVQHWCVVEIKTFWLDVRCLQQAIVGNYCKQWKCLDLSLRPQLFSLSQPNTKPTHLPEHESLSPTHQFSQGTILFV